MDITIEMSLNDDDDHHRNVTPSPNINQEDIGQDYFNYAKRAPWIRAATLGGIEGMLTVAILMMGVGDEMKMAWRATLLASFAALVAGALLSATAEYLAVCAEADVIRFQKKRDMLRFVGNGGEPELPSAVRGAMAATVSFLLVGAVPLLASGFIRKHKLRTCIAGVGACISLLGLGGAAAGLGKLPVPRSCVRLLVGGWLAILIALGGNRFLEAVGL